MHMKNIPNLKKTSQYTCRMTGNATAKIEFTLPYREFMYTCIAA